MKPYIAGLLWLGLGVCLFDVRLALAQRPFPSPNNPDEEQREECKAMIRSGERCENQGGGSQVVIELAGPVTVDVETQRCIKTWVVVAGAIPVPVFGERNVYRKWCIDPNKTEGVCISGNMWTEVGPCI